MEKTRAEGLTPVQEQVAARAAIGRRNCEIAAELGIGNGEVETHLTQIYRQLGVRSRDKLAARLAHAEERR